MPRAWKIAPGGHADNWVMCRDKGCIVIGWAALTDYSKYHDEQQVLRALQRAYGLGVKGCSSGTARTVFQFTRVIKKYDIVVAFEPSGKMLVSSQLIETERRLFGVVGASLAKTPRAKTAKYLAHH
jgi:predicted Mrr-cat superfamily restriction endonuclease